MNLRQILHERYREQIAEHEQTVKDLEEGRVHFEKRVGGQWVDDNQGMITSLRQTIRVLRQALGEEPGDEANAD